jgi:ABC-type phosphate/phosphonate transport system substrate-binding protein
VHAILDLQSAIDETHQVFADYLTQTAGTLFDPPIQFKVEPKDYDGVFKATMDEDIDFLYSNPGVYSCIGTQFGATALATIVRRVSIRGQSKDLDVYGGVIAVRSDNDQVNTILDLKDKVIGAGSILDLMGGQMQIYEMEKAGMSYLNDPKQVIFTQDQVDVVRGVASGRFDVGFVRTDQIELTTDENGIPFDPSLFKIIDPKMDIMDSGELFPFLHSTNVYPEWPLSALSHVAGDVQLAVENALRDFGKHAAIGQALQECYDKGNQTQLCDFMNFLDVVPDPPCGASEQLALLAAQGSNKSHIRRFRTASSYFDITKVEQDAGFMLQDDSTGGWQCTRPSSLFDGITCPEGHFKRNLFEFQNGCSQVGLSCKDNRAYECFCKPCVKAHEVDVYHIEDGEKDPHLEDYYGESLPGCNKMDICGTIEQGKSITLRIFDNMFRDDPVVNVTIHAGENPRNAPVRHLPGTHAYEFTVTDRFAQIQVIEIMVNGQAIDTSPIRVMVVDFDCNAEYGVNGHRVADAEGRCVCAGHTYPMGVNCIESTSFFLVIFSLVALVMGILVVLYLGYKKKQSDSVWHINVEELHFNEPPDIIGQGGFGVVILGEYRGTKVAVKRVLPPSNGSKSPSSSLTSESDEKEVNMEPTSSNGLSKYPKRRQSVTDKRKIKFRDDSTAVSGDIESQTTKKITNNGSHSCSGSSLGDWDRLFNGRHSSNDMLKLLESATLSDHGSGSFSGRYSSSKSGVLQRRLPLCLRFDQHSRRISEFVNEMRMLSRLRHPCITTVMGAVVSSSLDPMLGTCS